MTARSCFLALALAAALVGCAPDIAHSPPPDVQHAQASSDPSSPVGAWSLTDASIQEFASRATATARATGTDGNLDPLPGLKAQRVRFYADKRFEFQFDGGPSVNGQWSSEASGVVAHLNPDALNIFEQRNGGEIRFTRSGSNLTFAAPNWPAAFVYQKSDADPEAGKARPVVVQSLTRESVIGSWIADEPAMRAAIAQTRGGKPTAKEDKMLQMQVLLFNPTFNPDGTFVMGGQRGKWELAGDELRLDKPAYMTFTFKDGRLRGGQIILQKTEKP